MANYDYDCDEKDDFDYDSPFMKMQSTDFPVRCRAMYYFAKGRHAHQKRKATDVPYFLHCRGVAWLVSEHCGTLECNRSVDLINAALGHDLMEDTKTSFPELKAIFGPNVARLCNELTNNRFDIAEVGKEAYMTEKLLSLSEDALLIKLCDMLYNTLDNPTEDAAVRMYKNVCSLLLKRDLSPALKEVAHLVILSEGRASPAPKSEEGNKTEQPVKGEESNGKEG